MKLLSFFVVLVFFASCGDINALVSLEPEQQCWKISNRIEASIEHTGGALSLPVMIELDDDYPFSNLYLKVSLSSAGTQDTSWTQTQTFVDPLGNWSVPSSGGVHAIRHTILMDAVFPAGNYSLSLGHYMRPERICGVHSVSILSN